MYHTSRHLDPALSAEIIAAHSKSVHSHIKAHNHSHSTSHSHEKQKPERKELRPSELHGEAMLFSSFCDRDDDKENEKRYRKHKHHFTAPSFGKSRKEIQKDE